MPLPKLFLFFKSVTKTKANILVEGAPNAVAAKEPSARPREFLSHQVHRAAGALEKIIRYNILNKTTLIFKNTKNYLGGCIMHCPLYHLSRGFHPSLFGSLAPEEILGQVSGNIPGSAAAHRDLREPVKVCHQPGFRMNESHLLANSRE